MKVIIQQFITLFVFLMFGNAAVAQNYYSDVPEGNQATHAGNCTE